MSQGHCPWTGIGVSPQPVKSLGAFDAPVASAPVGSNAAGKTVPTKPVTTGLVLDADKGAVTQGSKPIAIPDVAWTQPKTVVQAKNQVPGEKAVITYVPDGDTAYYKDGWQPGAVPDRLPLTHLRWPRPSTVRKVRITVRSQKEHLTKDDPE